MPSIDCSLANDDDVKKKAVFVVDNSIELEANRRIRLDKDVING